MNEGPGDGSKSLHDRLNDLEKDVQKLKGWNSYILGAAFGIGVVAGSIPFMLHLIGK